MTLAPFDVICDITYAAIQILLRSIGHKTSNVVPWAYLWELTAFRKTRDSSVTSCRSLILSPSARTAPSWGLQTIAKTEKTRRCLHWKQPHTSKQQRTKLLPKSNRLECFLLHSIKQPKRNTPKAGVKLLRNQSTAESSRAASTALPVAFLNVARTFFQLNHHRVYWFDQTRWNKSPTSKLTSFLSSRMVNAFR